MSATVTPIRTHEQRMTALAAADAVRLPRAAKMREVGSLKAGDSFRLAADLLEDPPSYLKGMRAFVLLTKVRRMGPGGARKMMSRTFPEADIARMEGKKIGAMTERQRFALAAALRYRAGDYGAFDRIAA